MRYLFFLAYFILSLTPLSVHSQPPKVLVSIKPLHALVAGVMKDIGQPQLLLRGGESPHTYAMRPKDLKNIQQADVVFWVGASLEEFLAKPLSRVASKAVALLDTPGLERLPRRFWQDDHGHSHVHSASVDDAHIWLSPAHAQVLVKRLSEILSQRDPKNQKLYEKNVKRLISRLETLSKDARKDLEGVSGAPFLVFHDGYQYFEKAFNLNHQGVISLHPEVTPSIRKIKELKEKIKQHGIKCIFSEPQFPAGIVRLLKGHTKVQTGMLDPLGIELNEGEEAYFSLIKNLAKSFKKCLSS